MNRIEIPMKSKTYKVLKILNVGHGDSIILRPEDGCTFMDETILIDLGNGGTDITSSIGEEEKIHIFITHHDADHLGGLQFFFNKFSQVSEITVPFYQNEITLIAKAILNLKGIRSAVDCGEFIRALEDIVHHQFFIKKLTEDHDYHPKLSFAHDQIEYCCHIDCLNPPMIVDVYNWMREASESDLIKISNEIFEPEFARDMEIYIRGMRRGEEYVDSWVIQNIMLYEQQDSNNNRDINQIKGSFVMDFFMRNIGSIRKFNERPDRELLRKIYENYVKCTHDVCTVLKVKFGGKSFLLTGDATKKVFRRLIKEGKDISAGYLKMPHHGSIKNIDESILQMIKPEVAIISHGNRRFGKSKESLPNQETLELLEREKTRILITNDVKKDSLTVMYKEHHKDDEYVDIQ